MWQYLVHTWNCSPISQACYEGWTLLIAITLVAVTAVGLAVTAWGASATAIAAKAAAESLRLESVPLIVVERLPNRQNIAVQDVVSWFEFGPHATDPKLGPELRGLRGTIYGVSEDDWTLTDPQTNQAYAIGAVLLRNVGRAPAIALACELAFDYSHVKSQASNEGLIATRETVTILGEIGAASVAPSTQAVIGIVNRYEARVPFRATGNASHHRPGHGQEKVFAVSPLPLALPTIAD